MCRPSPSSYSNEAYSTHFLHCVYMYACVRYISYTDVCVFIQIFSFLTETQKIINQLSCGYLTSLLLTDRHSIVSSLLQL